MYVINKSCCLFVGLYCTIVLILPVSVLKFLDTFRVKKPRTEFLCFRCGKSSPTFLPHVGLFSRTSLPKGLFWLISLGYTYVINLFFISGLRYVATLLLI